MKSRFLRLAAMLALLVTFSAAAVAEDKVKIGVAFAVNASHFTSGWRPADVAEFTQQGAAEIAQALNGQIQFVEFSTKSDAPFKLEVLLADPNEKDPPGASSFGFHLTLTGPEISPPVKDYVEFRPLGSFFAPVGSVAALVREINEAFGRIAGQGFVKKFLSDVPIADSGEFHKDPSISWIIKRNRQDLCIGFDSVLRVRGQVPYGAVMRNAFFTAKVIDIPSEPQIFAETTEGPDSNYALLKDVDEKKVKVERVGVSDYFQCQKPEPFGPEGSSGAGGSQ